MNRCIVIAAASALALGGVVLRQSRADAATGFTYGLLCQNTFNGGLETLPFQEGCDAFSSQMSGVGSRIFRYNLEGTVGPRILENWADAEVENADIVVVGSHMGAWSDKGADIAGKNYPTVEAFSKNMKLGNAGKGLSVLALAGCATVAGDHRPRGDGVNTPFHQVEESYWPRWRPAFTGGMRLVLGNWDVYTPSKKVGDLFGKYLKQGGNTTYVIAWRRADVEAMPSNDTAVGSMGQDAGDCWDRVNKMAIDNMADFPRRQNDSVTYWCRWIWSNDSLGG